MKETGSEDKLWGIYHADRTHARNDGEPLRTVVNAPTKLAAEETASRLGFGDACARPITAEEAQRAQWLPQHRPGHRQELARSGKRGVRV